MTTLKQSKLVLSVLIKNAFSKSSNMLKFHGGKKEQQPISLNEKSKKGQKILLAFAVGLVLCMFLFYICITAFTLTASAIVSGVHEKVPYLFIFLSQFIVLFFGSIAMMNIMYFSKDNELLASLPIKPKALFIAKFAMSYMSELAMSAFVLLPTMITYGVVCQSYGISIGAGLYILTVLGVFIFPIIPLLFISILSLPLMHVISYIKKSTVANAIAVILMIVAVFSVYFLLIGNFSASMEGEDGAPAELAPMLQSMLIGISKATIFNYPMVEAMLGRRAVLNVFIYLVAIAAVFAIIVVLSSMFYRKGVSILLEGSGTSGKSKRKSGKERTYVKGDLKKSLFIKEIKTLANSPTMLVNALMGVVLSPLMVFLMVGMNMMDFGTGDAELASFSFAIYILVIAGGGTNQLAVVGFSREGKNLLYLKSLPLSADLMVKTKIYAASAVNVLTSTVSGIVYLIVSPSHDIILTLALMLISFTCGYGSNCLCLRNDLKNPNIRWNNINELMKNNKRTVRPVLIVLAIGFVYLILGMVLGMAAPLPSIWNRLLYFVICMAVNVVFLIFSHSKLFSNHEQLLAEIE